MPNTPLVGVAAVPIIPNLQGPALSYLIANNDPSGNNIWIAPDSTVAPGGSTSFLVATGGAFTINSTRSWWACTENDPASGLPLTTVLSIMPDGTSWAPAASQIADVIAPLADAIAIQIAQTGIPLVANPQLIYDIASSSGGGGGGGTGLFGVSLIAATTETNDMTTWQNVVGRPVETTKIYNAELSTTNNNWTTTATATINACIALKARACLCYSPPYTVATGMNATTKGNLFASASALKAILVGAGCPPPVFTFWQEPQVSRNGMSAAQYIACVQFFANTDSNGSGVRSIGSLAYDIEGFNMAEAGSYYPGDAFIDIVAVDYYAPDFDNGKLLATAYAVPGTPKPFGVWEMGNAASGVDPGQAKVTAYIQAVQTFLVNSVLGTGGTIDACMWYQNDKNVTGPNYINSSNDYRVPLLQALSDAISSPGGGGSGFTVAGGATGTLTPVNPSPGGAFAPATGLSYDINISAIAGASSTNPFAKVQLFWHDLDVPGAASSARQSFIIPMGANGTVGTNILGQGPMAGVLVAVKIQNLDTVTATFGVQMLSTSRQAANHRWHWYSGSSVAVPGYTLANGDGPAGVLCQEDPSVPGSGGTKTFLCSMFTGQIWVRLAPAGNFDLVIQEPTDDDAVVYHETSTTTEADLLITSPRCPLIATVTNNAASAANCNFGLFANE